MAEIGKDIFKAATVLKNSGVVAIPTETVYGLAANALDEKAVAQIFTVKNRPTFNPLIIHIAHKDDLKKYVATVPEVAEKLIEKFWPGPLTLLLPKKANVPHIVTASLPNVAIRVPDHALTLQLLQALDFPLAAPSANPFGYISPTTPAHVQRQIGEKIPYILDGGACHQGVESTIVGFEDNIPVVFRLGAIPLEALQEVAGEVKLFKKSVTKIESPGMLPYHYSPKTPLYITSNVTELLTSFDPQDTGVITFHEQIDNIPAEHVKVLSANADVSEAARNLYSALHDLDGMNLKAIIAEQFPDDGLGKTLNDRLERAGKRTQEEGK